MVTTKIMAAERILNQAGCGARLGLWLLTVALVILSGCEKPNWTGSMPAFVTLHGSVQGGHRPISGSSIQVYAAGTGGNDSAARPLLNQPAHSANDGSFSFTIACPSPTSLLYLTAKEGNPGLGPGIENPAIGLMAAAGACGELSSSSFITLNEVTTIGSIWPLASYMSSASHLGSNPGDASFSAALSLAGQLVDISHGASPGGGVPSGYVVQTAKLDSLADILDACINSYGGSAGDGSPCGLLFSLGTLRDVSPPTDTMMAALLIAQAPSQNVSNIYSLVPQGGAFQPNLSATPADWSLPLLPVPGAPVIDPSSGSYSAGQQVTLTDNTPNAVIHYTRDGSAPSASSAVYSSPITLTGNETVRAIAVEQGIDSAASSASYTITGARLVFSTQPANTVAGSLLGPPPVVTVVDSNGNRITSAANPITLSLSSANALSGPTTVTAVRGVASFPHLSVTTAGNGFTLVASSPGLVSTTSAAFSVTSPGITFALPSSSIDVGSTISGSIALGTPAGPGGVTVTLVSSSAKDVAVSPPVLTIASGQSSGAFTLSGVAAGPSTLSATATGYTPASTQVTAVTTAPDSAHLAFITQPVSTLTGAPLSPAPTVSVVDSNGNLMTSAVNPITLALNGSSAAALSGSSTEVAVHGIATFPNLSVTTAGSGLTLTATSPGVVSSTSTAFNVSLPANLLASVPFFDQCRQHPKRHHQSGAPAGPGGVTVSLASSSANDVGVSPSP